MRRRGLLFGLAVVPGLAQAQSYPDRPVTVVNPWPAGGSSDSVARILMQRMSADLGQPFVVENRPGATGTLGTTTSPAPGRMAAPCCSAPTAPMPSHRI